MSHTIYPILSSCPVPQEMKAAPQRAYLKKDLFSFFSEKAGWKPAFPETPEEDCVCIKDFMLSECILPDGQQGYLYNTFWDNWADHTEPDECFLVDAYDGERPFVLTGFTCRDGKAVIQYASQEDLGALYGAGRYIPGVTETASFNEGKRRIHGCVTFQEREYMQEALASCRNQGYRFDTLTFMRVVPVPADLYA